MNCRIIMLLLMFLHIGCGNVQSPKQSKQGVIPAKKDTFSYIFKNDTIIQAIKLSYTTDKLFYTYDVTNTKRGKSDKREGLAKKKKSINMELGEDEAGNAYPVDEYENKNGNCWFIVSVEQDKKRMVTIFETKECKNKNAYTPINSQGILRKEKKK